MTDSLRVVSALKAVPEVRLQILDLALRASKDGDLDYHFLAGREKEVNLAVAEAEAYMEEVKKLVNQLRQEFQ